MSIVTFFCDEHDDTLHISLEPYETEFQIEPGNEMSFEGHYPNREFKWIIKLGPSARHFVLKAERNDGKINVYDNDVLVEQW
jgi:hypothetical protein